MGKTRSPIRIATTSFWRDSLLEKFFLIGHAMDPIIMEASEQQILIELANASTKQAYYKALNRLTGIFIIGYIRHHSEHALLKVPLTGDIPGFFLGRVQCRQQHPGEDCDDRNHNEKFDQRETCHAPYFTPVYCLFFHFLFLS